MRTKTLKIYLIRHGLTESNIKRQYQGTGLNPDILPQSAEMIAMRTRKGKAPQVKTVWVSSLLRAQHTADLYFPHLPKDIKTELCERNFGDWEGKTHFELENDLNYQKFLETFGKAAPTNGETYSDFSKRLDLVWESAVRFAALQPEAFPLALVCHGGVVIYLTEKFLPEDSKYYRYYIKGGGALEITLDVTTECIGTKGLKADSKFSHLQKGKNLSDLEGKAGAKRPENTEENKAAAPEEQETPEIVTTYKIRNVCDFFADEVSLEDILEY